jgi:hypothetical protein
MHFRTSPVCDYVSWGSGCDFAAFVPVGLP